MRATHRRLKRLESPKGKLPWKDMLVVHSKEEVGACRAWWRKKNPSMPDQRLLVIINNLPRKENALPPPWLGEVTE